MFSADFDADVIAVLRNDKISTPFKEQIYKDRKRFDLVAEIYYDGGDYISAVRWLSKHSSDRDLQKYVTIAVLGNLHKEKLMDEFRPLVKNNDLRAIMLYTKMLKAEAYGILFRIMYGEDERV